MALDMTKVKRYRDLKAEAKRLEAELDGVKKAATALEEELVEAFTDEGVQNMRVDGNTVYLERTLWAQREKGVTPEEVVAALRAAGLDALVGEGVNMNTLSSHLRELDEHDTPLPDALVGKVKAAEVFKVKVRGL